jgi:hypothetical protein
MDQDAFPSDSLMPNSNGVAVCHTYGIYGALYGWYDRGITTIISGYTLRHSVLAFEG